MLQIGNNSSTLINLPYEANNPVTIDPIYQKIEKISPHGVYLVRFTGQTKALYGIKYNNLTKTERDQILTYCNQPKAYYVKYLNTEPVILFQGLAYLFSSDEDAGKDTKLYSLTITIRMR
jgi:hypothetical protein